MLDLCRLIFAIASDLLRSRVALEAEILVLRQQINVLRRANPKRLRFVSIDRLILGGVCRLFPKMYGALAIVRPETVIRWHRAGFRSYWRWKSKHRCGRPAVTVEIRQLIRQMSGANPLWGAPRIHGELLKLGIDVGQTSVAKYMVRRRVPPSQGWRTFLRNHADGIAAMDLFVVPTISFRPLYGLLIMGHGRRQLLWFGVTAHPTAEWIANQLTEACGWEQIPRYLIRDRDGAYGEIFIRRVRSIGCGALPRDRFRPYVPFNVKATRPRCDDEGCPDRPGRASHKESESWSIIAKRSWRWTLRNCVMRWRLPMPVETVRFAITARSTILKPRAGGAGARPDHPINGHRPRDVRDVGRLTLIQIMCKRIEEDLARRLFRPSGRPIGRPFPFRLSVVLQHGFGRGGQLGLHYKGRAKHTRFSLGFAANFSSHPASSRRTGTNRFR